MHENCENTCPGLTRLEQQVDDIRRQNGDDHKDFRERIKEIETEEARQAERFDRIMDNLADLKSDNKVLVSQLSPLTHKVETLEQLSGAVDELKTKPAKRWDNIVGQIIGLVVAAVVGMLLGRVGL